VKYEIILSSKYKKACKKISHDKEAADLLKTDIARLCAHESLPVSERDHQLEGKFHNCRECHIKPDLLLMYEIIDDKILILHDLGSHSELFG